MVQCPQCRATLPPGSFHCHFCGASWGPPAGTGHTGRPGSPGATGQRGYAAKRRGNWVWTAYYVIAAWWILQGVLGLAEGALTGKSPSILGMGFGAFNALVGLGLILKVELARGIVNVLAFLNILFGLFQVVGLFFAAPLLGAWGPVLLVLTFVNIALSGLMIYVIGETETRGPNF